MVVVVGVEETGAAAKEVAGREAVRGEEAKVEGKVAAGLGAAPAVGLVAEGKAAVVKAAAKAAATEAATEAAETAAVTVEEVKEVARLEEGARGPHKQAIPPLVGRCSKSSTRQRHSDQPLMPFPRCEQYSPHRYCFLQPL